MSREGFESSTSRNLWKVTVGGPFFSLTHSLTLSFSFDIGTDTELGELCAIPCDDLDVALDMGLYAVSR